MSTKDVTTIEPAAADSDRLLSTVEAARLLHLHVGTLQKYVREGAVPSVLIGSGARRFRRSDLDKWLDSKLEGRI